MTFRAWKPRRPADRRENDEPYYIDSDCPECGEELTPVPDAFEDGWYDEFECSCEGVHMDWPESEFEELKERAGRITEA